MLALPLVGIVCWRSKKNKKRNAILTFISPFVFIYTFYFGCMIGGFTCSSVFGTGCGIDGYYHATLPNGYELETISDDFDRVSQGTVYQLLMTLTVNILQGIFAKMGRMSLNG